MSALGALCLGLWVSLCGCRGESAQTRDAGGAPAMLVERQPPIARREVLGLSRSASLSPRAALARLLRARALGDRALAHDQAGAHRRGRLARAFGQRTDPAPAR